MKCLAIVVLFTLLIFRTQVWAENNNQEAFSLWLDGLKQEALEKGFNPDLVESALGDVVYVERAVRSDRSQAEFKETYQQYINKRVSQWRIKTGKEYLAQHGKAMSEVVDTYAVPAEIIAAIIGVETNYGTFTLSHDAFNALATLAFDPRRADRFRREIFDTLTILSKKYAQPEQLKSSWAGALGIPQFMPSSYLQFAVDFDKDGDKDIWSHGPDLWASVAHYLSYYGYSNTQKWARKVIVPAAVSNKIVADTHNISAAPKGCKRYKKHLKGWRSLADWNSAGIRRLNGQDLPLVDMVASFLLTDPEQNKGYIVYSNFCSIMRYNPSTKYALSVGALADAIRQ